MRGSTSRPVIAAFALGACLATTAAHAQPAEEDPEALVARAVELRNRQRPQEALPLLEASYERARRPRTAALLALTETSLGRWVSAEAHLREALAAEDDPWVNQNRASLRATSSTLATHLGSVEVACDTAGAEVWIDGARVATLPREEPLRVRAGTTTMEFRAEGRATVTRLVTVAGGGATRVEVNFTPRVEPSRATTTGPQTPATQGPVDDAPRPDGTLRALAWGALGGVALGLGAGAAGYFLREAAAARWNDDTRCLRGDLTREQTCASDRATAESMTALFVAGAAVAGAFAVASATLFVVSRPRATTRVTLRCGPGASMLSVGCVGAF